MTEPECEIVADAGTRLRIIADGMFACGVVDPAMTDWARAVDEVRVRLCALPIESEGGENA